MTKIYVGIDVAQAQLAVQVSGEATSWSVSHDEAGIAALRECLGHHLLRKVLSHTMAFRLNQGRDHPPLQISKLVP